MFRVSRLLVIFVIGLLPASTQAATTDAVFLQEVVQKIPTEKPVWAVAVFQGKIHAGMGDGLYAVSADSTLTRVGGGEVGMIAGLHVFGSVLWIRADSGLWRFDGSALAQVSSEFVTGVAQLGEEIVVSTRSALLRVKDDTLESWSGPAPGPIHSIAVYAETIYCLGFDRIFLYDGADFIHEGVIEFGAFPSKDLRAILSQGSRLIVGTHQGLGVYRGGAATQLLAADGLPWDVCKTLAPGFEDDYWIGTTRGAIRAVDGEFQYFVGSRWLPNDHVNAIACDENRAIIATHGGLSIVDYHPMTLEAKADYYERHLESWGQKRGAFTHKLEWDAGEQQWMREVSDNDIGWSTHYWAANAFKYAATGDETARQRAIDGFYTMKWSEEITPLDGFPARSIWAVGEIGHKAGGGSGGYPAEWHRTDDDKWEWKGDTSSDEIDAHFYYAAIFYDLVANEKQKVDVREHVARIADHIIDNGWVLRDVDGKPTVWGRWDPEYFASAFGHYARGLNGLEVLTFIRTAHAMTGEQRFADALEQLFEWGYDDEVVRQKIVDPRGINHSDDRLAFYCYYALLKYESDPRLRSIYRRSLERSWEIERIEKIPWFNFIYGALTGNDCEADAAVEHLRAWPLDLVDHGYDHSHRRDLDLPSGYMPYAGVERPLSPRETGPKRWTVNQGRLSGGSGGNTVVDPAGWLDAYWMGRYYGYISAPREEVETLPVVPPAIPVAPYDGPPMPITR